MSLLYRILFISYAVDPSVLDFSKFKVLLFSLLSLSCLS